MKYILHEGKRIDQDCITLLKQITDPMKTKFTVSVEGNIGCGKSTLLQYFSSSKNVETLTEPVDKWCNVQGDNALQLLYSDSKKWSFSFNYYAMLTRMYTHCSNSNKPVKMLERSLHSTMKCFVENSYNGQDLNEAEYLILKSWYDHLATMDSSTVDLYVYLRAPPDVCINRIRKRARKEEDSIPVELIHNLHELHDRWLLNPATSNVTVRSPLKSVSKNSLEPSMEVLEPSDVQSAVEELRLQIAKKKSAPVLVLDASYDLSMMKSVWEKERQEILCGYD